MPRVPLLVGLLLLSGCGRLDADPTPAASLDQALAAQDAALRYIDRVNIYDATSAVDLSSPDRAETTRRILASLQERQVRRTINAISRPDHCAQELPCRIHISGQLLIKGQQEGLFNAELVMGFRSGRWVVLESVGEELPTPPG